MTSTPSPAPSSASQASQASAANGEALPEWPKSHHACDYEGCSNCEDYERALAATWEARARLAVEALESVSVDPTQRDSHYSFRKYMRGIYGCTCPGDHFCKCGRSSMEMNLDELIEGGIEAHKALAGIGPLPAVSEPPSPKEQRT